MSYNNSTSNAQINAQIFPTSNGSFTSSKLIGGIVGNNVTSTSIYPNYTSKFKDPNEILSNKVELFKLYNYRTIMKEFEKQELAPYELDAFVEFIFDNSLINSILSLENIVTLYKLDKLDRAAEEAKTKKYTTQPIVPQPIVAPPQPVPCYPPYNPKPFADENDWTTWKDWYPDGWYDQEKTKSYKVVWGNNTKC